MRQLKLVFIATIAAYLSTCPAFAYGKKANDKLQFTQGTIVFSRSDSAHTVLIAEDENNLTRQQKVVYFFPSNRRDTLTATADEVKYFSISGKKYLSIPIQTSKGSKRIFSKISRRNKKQTPLLYKIYLTEDKYEVFMAEAEGMPAIQITMYNKMKDATLTNFMLAKNSSAGGDEEIASKIKNIKPNSSSIRLINNLIECQNPNRIPQTRWGVGIGTCTGFCKFSTVTWDAPFSVVKCIGNGSSTTAEATLFADFRGWSGLSFHPEISFYKVSCIYEHGNHRTGNDHTALVIPLMMRYTFVYLRGKWLPYVEAGVQPSITLKDKRMDLVINSSEYNDYTWESYSDKDMGMSIIGGAGIEYCLTKKHSLFLDVKYAYQNRRLNSGNTPLMVNPLTFNLSYNF